MLFWNSVENCGTVGGGRGGIRTHEGLAPLAVFKTAALNRSATLPDACRGGIWGAPEEGVNWTPLMSEAEVAAVPAALAATPRDSEAVAGVASRPWPTR
jgi:hypothetical protein